MGHAAEIEVAFEASRSAGTVHGILRRSPDAEVALVLAHGAGAGMRHAFLASLAESLAGHRVATLRWQFPYMEKGSRRPDPQPLLLASVRSAVAQGRQSMGDLPLFAGGKSMGGRMTSLAAAADELAGVLGLVFFGFPLHPAGKPGVQRAEHLARVSVPLLFLQGTRDKLADMALLAPIVSDLGAVATMHALPGADHSFHVLRSSGRTDADLVEELAWVAAQWMRGVAGKGAA